MTTLILHAPEDSHLVRPLQRFLELSGIECECGDVRPKILAAENTLVICGDTLDTNGWLVDILRDRPDVVLVQITPAPIPFEHDTVVDLHNWPSRSADKTLVTLADWLKQGRPGSFSPRNVAAAESARKGWLSENAAPMMLLAVMVIIVATLLSFEQPMSAAVTSAASQERVAHSTGSGTFQDQGGQSISSLPVDVNTGFAATDNNATAPEPTGTNAAVNIPMGSHAAEGSGKDPATSSTRIIAKCIQDTGSGCALVDCAQPVQR